MTAEEGLSSLWKGHNAAQLLSMVFGAVQFSSYELLYDFSSKTWNNKSSPLANHILNCGCGCVAGVLATVVSFPFDVIRTHLVFQGEPKVRCKHYYHSKYLIIVQCRLIDKDLKFFKYFLNSPKCFFSVVQRCGGCSA